MRTRYIFKRYFPKAPYLKDIGRVRGHLDCQRATTTPAWADCRKSPALGRAVFWTEFYCNGRVKVLSANMRSNARPHARSTASKSGEPKAKNLLDWESAVGQRV